MNEQRRSIPLRLTKKDIADGFSMKETESSVLLLRHGRVIAEFSKPPAESKEIEGPAYMGAFVRPTMVEALRAVVDWLESEGVNKSVLAIIADYEESGSDHNARAIVFWEEL